MTKIHQGKQIYGLALTLLGIASCSCNQFLPHQTKQSLEIYPLQNNDTMSRYEDTVKGEVVLQQKCEIQVGQDFYDLRSFAKAQDWYKLLDHDKDNIIYFNFCRDLNFDAMGCQPPLDPTIKTMAVLQSQNDKKCFQIAGSVEQDSTAFSHDDNGNLQVEFLNDPDDNYGLTIKIECSSSDFDHGKAVTTIINKMVGSFDSKIGCEVGELSAIWIWLSNNKWPLFVILLLIGLPMTFFGNLFFKPVLFFTGVLQASFLCMIICYSTFTKHSSEVWVGWVILVISTMIGLGIGFLFIKYKMVGAFFLSAWAGFSFGLLIYNSFIYKLDSDVALWCFTVGMGLLYGGMIFFFFDQVLILATSLLGSFLTVYGIGMVAGRYTNPFTLAQLINHGQLDSIDPMFYAYLAGNIVLCALGVVYQYIQFKKTKELSKALRGSTASLVSGTKVNESKGNTRQEYTNE